MVCTNSRRPIDRAINMRLSRQVDDLPETVFGQQLRDSCKITNLTMDKRVTLILEHIGQRIEIAGIGQLIENSTRDQLLQQSTAARAYCR